MIIYFNKVHDYGFIGPVFNIIELMRALNICFDDYCTCCIDGF